MNALNMPGQTELVWNKATLLLALNAYIEDLGGALFEGLVVTEVSERNMSGCAEYSLILSEKKSGP